MHLFFPLFGWLLLPSLFCFFTPLFTSLFHWFLPCFSLLVCSLFLHSSLPSFFFCLQPYMPFVGCLIYQNFAANFPLSWLPSFTLIFSPFGHFSDTVFVIFQASFPLWFAAIFLPTWLPYFCFLLQPSNSFVGCPVFLSIQLSILLFSLHVFSLVLLQKTLNFCIKKKSYLCT